MLLAPIDGQPKNCTKCHSSQYTSLYKLKKNELQQCSKLAEVSVLLLKSCQDMWLSSIKMAGTGVTWLESWCINRIMLHQSQDPVNSASCMRSMLLNGTLKLTLLCILFSSGANWLSYSATLHPGWSEIKMTSNLAFLFSSFLTILFRQWYKIWRLWCPVVCAQTVAELLLLSLWCQIYLPFSELFLLKSNPCPLQISLSHLFVFLGLDLPFFQLPNTNHPLIQFFTLCWAGRDNEVGHCA